MSMILAPPRSDRDLENKFPMGWGSLKVVPYRNEKVEQTNNARHGHIHSKFE